MVLSIRKLLFWLLLVAIAILIWNLVVNFQVRS
jgi:hypothetical protein